MTRSEIREPGQPPEVMDRVKRLRSRLKKARGKEAIRLQVEIWEALLPGIQHEPTRRQLDTNIKIARRML